MAGGIEGAGNLRQSGVRSLRGTAKARNQQGETVQRFDVNMMKNGESMDLTGVADGKSGRESGESGGRPNEAARQQLTRGMKSVSKARNAHKSQLPVEEQVAQLSKIRKSAVEYESVLMDQFVKQMRQSPLVKTPGGDTFSDIAEQPFRDFLSKAGGLGLADSITSQVARQQGLEQTLHDYPEIMGPGWRPTIPPNLMKKSSGGLELAPENLNRQGDGASGPASDADRADAAAEPEPAGEPEKTAEAGPMSSEEIAWLYNDAVEAWG